MHFNIVAFTHRLNKFDVKFLHVLLANMTFILSLYLNTFLWSYVYYADRLEAKRSVPHIECIKTRGKVWSKECRHHGRPLLHSHGVFFSLPLQNKPNTLQYYNLITSENNPTRVTVTCSLVSPNSNFLLLHLSWRSESWASCLLIFFKAIYAKW